VDPRRAALLSQFVLDASAVLVLMLDDEPEGPVTPLLEALSSFDPIVPMLWDCEVANALMAARRRGRISASDVTRSLQSVSSMGCTRDTQVIDPSVLASAAAEHDVTAYDAAYLLLAIRRGAPLATVDRQLARAAVVAGVPLVC
jgi:predicted nucleic acid-binding protein